MGGIPLMMMQLVLLTTFFLFYFNSFVPHSNAFQKPKSSVPRKNISPKQKWFLMKSFNFADCKNIFRWEAACYSAKPQLLQSTLTATYLPASMGFRRVLFTFDNRRVLGELNQRLKLFLIGNSRPQLLVKECLKYNC